jgi:hypothetical protein
MATINEVQVKRPMSTKQIDVDAEHSNQDISIKKDIFYQNPEQPKNTTDLGLDLLANKTTPDDEYEDYTDDEQEYEDDENDEQEYEQDQVYDDDEYQEDEPERPVLTLEQTQEKKAYYLHQLGRFTKRGVKHIRQLGMHHSLEDIENEYRRIKKEMEIDSAINYGRQGLMFCIQTIERLNGHFDPVGARLDGWSQQVYTELNNYDEIFEELYEKYHTRVKMMPELKLIFALSASGFMFHIQKSIIEKTSQNGNMVHSLMNAMNNLNKVNESGKREMKGPSMNTDELLQQLSQDADETVSLTDSNHSLEIQSVSVPTPKKRGRKPK